LPAKALCILPSANFTRNSACGTKITKSAQQQNTAERIHVNPQKVSRDGG
jgi:hypothetical protein